MFEQEILNNYTARILDKQLDTNKVVTNQKQLNINQYHNLQQVLAKYGKLFDEFFVVYPHQRVHIDLLPCLEPVHNQTYLVPCSHEKN